MCKIIVNIFIRDYYFDSHRKIREIIPSVNGEQTKNVFVCQLTDLPLSSFHPRSYISGGMNGTQSKQPAYLLSPNPSQSSARLTFPPARNRNPNCEDRGSIMADTYCKDCKKQTEVVFDHAAGDTICSECGLVLEAHTIDETSEWRTFANESNDNDPVRVGGPYNPLLTDGGLSTVIAKPNGSSGEFLNSSLGKWQGRGANPDRNLIQAFKSIAIMSDRCPLPSVYVYLPPHAWHVQRAAKVVTRIVDMPAVSSRLMPVFVVLADARFRIVHLR